MNLSIEKIKHSSGSEIWYVQETSIPVIAIDIVWRGGATQDPNGKESLARLTADLMTEGAGDLDAKAFQEKLASLAADINCNADYDYFYCHVKMLAQNKDQVLDLLKNVIQKPRFDPESITQIKMQQNALIESHQEDPDWLASRAFYEVAVQEGHPYRRLLDGTSTSVKNITRDDLLSYKNKILAKDNLFISIVGPMHESDVKKFFDTVFLPISDKSSLSKIPEVVFQGGREKISFIANPQTVAIFGMPAPSYKDKNFIPFLVMNYILGGGGFSSRLMNEVREKRGLAYSVSTSVNERLFMPHVSGYVGTKNDQMKESLAIIRAQIAKMAQDGVTSEELKDAKTYLIGAYPLGFDSNGRIAARLLSTQLAGFDIEFINKRNTYIQNVTIDDIKNVAGSYLNLPITVGMAGDLK